MLNKYIPQLVNKLLLEFPLLSDPGNRVAESLGAVISLSEEMKGVYQGFGIDLERFNGDASWRLPLPGRIIVDHQGVVRDIDLHADHTTRPEPADSLSLLRSLGQ